MQTIGNVVKRFGPTACLLSLVVIVGMLLLGYRAEVGPAVVFCLAAAALVSMHHAKYKSYAFTVWVFVSVAASMFYPWAFGTWLGFDLKYLIVPLIQIIMFGMGTTLSVADFARVVKMPWPVLIGIVLQFTVMPLTGYTIAMTFGFPAEVAAGVILIGSCPGGVASNLMTYLARGNVALSVTMTSCSTLLSPLMTPFTMMTLAGRLVPINFVAMMLSILNMIIVPILAGLLANRILYSDKRWAGRTGPLVAISVAHLALAVAMLFVSADAFGKAAILKRGIIIGSALIGVVALTKWLVGVMLKRTGNWMDRVLPIVSMAAICFIIGIITARSRQDLLSVGAALIAAVVLHNFIGYGLGYWLARAARLDERTCRTVAFEVGMQNGGMASGLAMNVLDSAKAALAPAIFGPWMNVSGSVLSTWWHGKPLDDDVIQPSAKGQTHGAT